MSIAGEHVKWFSSFTGNMPTGCTGLHGCYGASGILSFIMACNCSEGKNNALQCVPNGTRSCE